MSETTPSPVSDGSSSSEGTVLRDFVDQAIAEKRLPTLSPRAAILSQSSLKSPVAEDKSSAIGSGAVDPGRQVRKRSNGSRRTRGREVAKGSALSQLVDVDLTRKDPKDEVMRLRDILKTVERHSALEARRVKELERANLAAERKAQQLMETQLQEKQEALKAQQEVRLVNLQLRNAQEELERKQQEVKRIEQQRDEAEAEAERANEKARKFREQTIAAAAREEGRRMGFKAGLDFATRERQMIAAKKASMQATRPRDKVSSGDRRGASHADKGKRKAIKGRPPTAYMPPPAEAPPPTLPASYSIPHVEDLHVAPPPPTDPHPLEAPLDMQPPDNALSPSSSPKNYDTIIEPVIPRKPLVNPKGPYVRLIQPHEDGTYWAYTTPLPPKKSTELSGPPNDPAEKPIEHLPPPNDPPQARTPPISIFQLDIPSAEELNRQYSYSQENSNDAIHQGPRDQWVTASSYHERRGQGRPPPRVDAPLQPLPLNPPRPKPIPQQPGPKVKFPNILSRPSLLKTKAQNSWYRTLSWRKKNKQVIDPAPEQYVPTSADPNSASTYDSQPPTATDPRYTGGSQYAHEQRVMPPEAWYQPPPPRQQPVMPGTVPSMRSAYSRRHPSDAVSAVSTRVSEFDLLATPHPAAMSMRSGKESRKVKDNFMSPIKENPASRGNSPSANEERAAQASQENMRSMASVFWQPGMEHRPVQQEPSYGTFNSQNKRKSRRPPTISVPDPDQELEPFGVAYNRDATANGYPSYSGADLNRRPTRVSEKTTPGTAIGIDVVPPSGFAPDGVQSPPHTGQNHLSPYHSYHAAAPLFKQSVTSLRRPGSTRPPSAAAMSSRKQSQQSFGAYADPPPGAWGSSVPSVVNTAPPRPPSSAARPSSRMSRPATASQRATPQPPSYAPFSGLGSMEDYAQSMRSRHTPAANPAPFASTSQVSLSNLTGTGGVLGQPRNASATRLVLASPLHRVVSNASMRSQDTRYSRFDPAGYVDPALWVDGEPPAPPSVSPAEGREPMDYFNPAAPQRVATASPGLSYMSNPYEK